jgi:hypothetical protein
MSTLLDLIIEWIVSAAKKDELTPEQRGRLAYLGRVLESPDAIDAELEADARDRAGAITAVIPVFPPKDIKP